MSHERSKHSLRSFAVDPTGEADRQVELLTTDEAAFDPSQYGIGEVISGRFRVDEVIGLGSMGVVLAATHLELDEKVAIKFVRTEMQSLPGVLQRFAREAKATVSLKSEHIARVFDVGTLPGVGPYIVMEYLDGRDLGRVLQEQGRLSVRRAVHYILQACEALAVAHAADIIHRDMKPENLFLTQHGELELIKLLDFGISKATLTGRIFGDELSGGETACMLGTPLYMSPEQIESTDTVDHRTDIWSLGAVLYELITGESAFVADSVSQVWHRILKTDPVAIAQYCPEAPPALQTVVDRCLAKNPAHRYQNIAEVAAALLPFAPSRAHTYAQRSASILGISSESVFPVPIGPTIEPIYSSMAVAPPSSLATVSFAQAPPPQVAAPPPPARGRSGALLALFGSLSLLGAATVLWFQGGRELLTEGREQEVVARPSPSAAQSSLAAVPPAAAQPMAERTQPTPGTGRTRLVSEVPKEPEPVLMDSRPVRVESTPPGAVVRVGGQVLGITPLTSLLPVGVRELSLRKAGFESREILLQLEPAPEGVEPVVTSVQLTAKPPPPRARRRSVKATRAASKSPVPSKPSEEKASAKTGRAAPPPSTPPKPSNSATPPLVESTRPRLLTPEDSSRARILE